MSVFDPHYRITPAITRALVSIELSHTAVLDLPIDVRVLANLRQTARLASTHYSTMIEGNRLTQEEVEEALKGVHLPGRERDEAEVRNYYRALEKVDALATKPGHLSEQDTRRLHGLVMNGRPTPTAYRTGQNVIRDGRSRGIVYMPPEAIDVPRLMVQLHKWINRQLDSRELPAPLAAAIAHYQFATIHPYYDGNGRTARLLATLVLHKLGYGLKGIYSLEEHYARDLSGYYAALTVGPSHNYYEGRAEADITGFLDYFCRSMATALEAVRLQASNAAMAGRKDSSGTLRRLNSRQRRVLELYDDRSIATTAEIAAHIVVGQRTAATYCRQWVDEGFLKIADPSRKARSYRLADVYEDLITNESSRRA